jgi:hypothetical protein
MEATELFLKEGRPAGVFFCGKCRRVSGEKDIAEQCCLPRRCDKCSKETLSQSAIRCQACWDAEKANRERERFKKAEKLTEWSGWVYADGVGYRDGYCESLDEFYDWLDENPMDIQYVWACKENFFAHADIEDLLTPILDNAYEDFDSDDFKGLAELKAAIAAFNDVNAGLASYEPDYTKAVLLDVKRVRTAISEN